MTARFAGSRTLDERRRRRLSQESADGESAPPPSKKKVVSTAGAEISEPAPESSLPAADESIIPKSLWRIAAVAGLGAVVWGFVLYLGVSDWPQEIGIGAIVSLDRGGLINFFSMACLFVAAQASSVILWYRSRCRKDFMGRYRVWAWIAGFYLLMSFTNATGIHRPVSLMVAGHWSLNVWRPEVMIWLAPSAAAMIACHQLLIREVRHSPASLWIAHGCFGIGCCAGALHLAADLLFVPTLAKFLAAAVTTFWFYLLMVLSLVHARFVVHFNNEAPPKRAPRASRVIALVRLLLRGSGKRLAGVRKRMSERREQKRVEKEKRRENRLKTTETETSKKTTKEKSADKKPVQQKTTEKNVAQKDPVEAKPPARRRKSKKSSSSQPTPAKTSAVQVKEQPKPEASPTQPSAKTSEATTRKLRRDPPSSTPTPHAEPQVSSSKPTSQADAAATDPSPDDVDLSKLSKRERRRLKKQQRQK